MSNLIEPAPPVPRPNPLIWISLIAIGLIVFILLSSDRGRRLQSIEEMTQLESGGEIERSLLIPPGMRARQYIAEIREGNQPYPLVTMYDRGSGYQNEGSLADAHLLYFFSAREGYLPAMMKLGELADPELYRSEDSLLDRADVIQAYKWYQKAATLGHEPAIGRIKNLRRWATAESNLGNADARQLLLNFD
jgi:TPR repeat protein